LHSEAESEDDDDQEETPAGEHLEQVQMAPSSQGFQKKPDFDSRNTESGLKRTLENLRLERSQPWSEKEKAMAWLSRQATLQGVPATFLDALLRPENFQKLALLGGETAAKMKKTLDKKVYFAGYEKSLASGTKVTYTPVTHALQRSMMGEKMARAVNDTATAVPAEALWKALEEKGFFTEGRNQVSVLFWDPFRRWRSKGGSTG